MIIITTLSIDHINRGVHYILTTHTWHFIQWQKDKKAFLEIFSDSYEDFLGLLRIYKIHKSDIGSHNQPDGMSHNNNSRTTTLLTFMLIHQLRNNILVTCIRMCLSVCKQT